MSLGSSFWRLFASSSTSNLADGMALVAMPLLAASLTRDPVAVSAVAALGFVPWLLAVPGGALVDRLDRRRVMGWANLLRALLYGGLALLVADDRASMPLVYGAVLALGLVEVLYDSAARAMLPQVVPRAQLDRGNSLLTVGETVGGSFAGAPLGALLFAVAAAWPFLGVATAYLAGAVLVLGLRGSFRVAHPDAARAPTTLRADVAEGMRWLLAHRFLRGMTLAAGWFGLLQAMVNGVMVLFALETLGLSEAEFGLLAVAAAVGSIGGGLLAPRVSRLLGRGAALVVATAVSPLCLIGMGLAGAAGSAVGAALFFALSGAAVTLWNVLSMSVRQAMIPAYLFGRVLGAYRTVIWGVIPVGALLGGLLASLTSLATVFVVAGAGQIAVVAQIGRLMRRHREDLAAAYAEPQPVE